MAAKSASNSAPRSTKSTEPANASSRSYATATATVVLPTPPGPTMVTKREAASRIDSARMSSARPTIRDERAGRFASGMIAVSVLFSLALLANNEIGATKRYPRPA